MSRTRRTLLALLALALLKRPADRVLATMLPDVSVSPVPICVAGMLVSLLLLGLPAWLLRPWTSARLTRTDALWPDLCLAIVAGLLARVALPPLDAAWQGWLRISPASMPVPSGLPMTLLYSLALSVVPAVTEEAFFRGALLTSLLDGGRRSAAALMTALAFVLMHGRVANMPSLMAVSLLLTALMLRTGHVAVPMTAHLIYNLTALWMLMIPAWGSILCGAVLAAMLMMLCVRRGEMAHPPMKRLDGLLAAAALLVLAGMYFV
ncbi:MAG: CPBP family intramembrane metalloprotease [Clostridiales bacterium]|nr:CPBP family intramembrane metalloprotease [Clostridiales bacterium]